MEACINGVRAAAVNLALLLIKGSVISIRSLDGIQQFSVSDAAKWLERCSREMTMPESSRQQLDILLAQLMSENGRIENRYMQEKGMMGGQFADFNDKNDNRRVGNTGNIRMDAESYRDIGRDRQGERGKGRERESIGRGDDIDRRFWEAEVMNEREREQAWEREKEEEREREFGQKIMHR